MVLPVAWIAEDMHITWIGELVLALFISSLEFPHFAHDMMAMIRRGEVSRYLRCSF